MPGRRGATVPTDPVAAARALLEMVDAAQPSPRVRFGALFRQPVTEIAAGIYGRRLKEVGRMGGPGGPAPMAGDAPG